ncbi:MAG: cation transporter [Omnitrophica bacterium RIFCSPLOWO2_12_FULL_44_17]|uniref:Cation transporter n=1 Tax=Candidatus Danuiimicrobium aquiferis TaxID=1801832 RepID=A0A1G1KYU4_9BACT|nr:MAG: cation transporter [Omnitrophica bacterium RIFCSPHIGHO2_02_FULL_45_28]OGW92144.1 MAG: cation transporter [Omnitrophica bacterium RIFCSPHIGHO2_12_FULL_44_12]OGW98078.1 MAG: cation transporter [Omnitrophica bacterium RIFCSPLOWO2_12_FULL_44_17]OGX03480.1 MAG: cation transporter [Omnitrophica bacterium RIFCSPLOWO2_02_FULL_44_11]
MDHHQHHHSHFIDPSIVTHERGLWAAKWSFVILIGTGLAQLIIVFLSQSVALLADTIHNFGDAATSIPLGIAFVFARLKPNRKFSYGYGRVEDIAGVAVVFLILASGCFAGYEAVRRFIHPEKVGHIGWVAVASVLSFFVNEGVAIFRIKIGKEIGSAALVADGYHARIDGWSSLAVLVGALGIYFGFPAADPLMGLLITISILFIVWQTGKEVFTRMLDGIDPHILEDIDHIARHIKTVKDVWGVRARWIGHKLNVEINIAVASDTSLAESHDIAEEVRHQLQHHLAHFGSAIVHVDPENKSGEERHRVNKHSHDDLPEHSH